MVGDVYDPSLSELRAWQQQPVIARTLQTPVHSSAAGMGTDQSTASLQAQEQIIAQPNDDNVQEPIGTSFQPRKRVPARKKLTHTQQSGRNPRAPSVHQRCLLH